MWLIALVSPAFAACPATAEALRSTADEALAHWVDADTAGFLAIEVDLSCLAAPIGPADAARVHLVHALRAHLEKDPDGMRRAFEGLKAADNTFVVPESIIAPGSELAVSLQSARADEQASVVLPRAAWQVDGQPAAAVPRERAAVLQRIEASAAPGWYLPGGQPLPAAVVQRHTSRPLLVAGSAVAVVGVGALVTAALLREAYLSPQTSDVEAEQLRAPNLAAGIGGLTLVVGGAGLGAAAVIVGEW